MSIIGKIARIAKKDRAQDYDHNGLIPESYIQNLLLSMITCTDNCLRNKPQKSRPVNLWQWCCDS